LNKFFNLFSAIIHVFRSIQLINDSIVEFEKYFDQIKAKTSEELKRLTEENSRTNNSFIQKQN
jgi:hypothetical protein